MSLTQGPVRPPDIFADVKFWVEGSLAERDTIVSNIEIRGGKSVGTIHEAQYAVVRPTYSDDLRRTIASLGIPSIMASWIPQSIEAGHMLPASPFLPSTLSPAPSNPPVSTLQMQQKEAPSVSGESTAVDSPAHQGARVSSIHINGGPSNNSSEHSPVIPDDDAGESEIDELDQSLPIDSPNRKKRGKAYTAQDIADMRAHYRAQMELNPRPSHSAIWETFAYSHPHRKASSWQQYYYNHKSLFTGPGALSTSAPPPPLTPSTAAAPGTGPSTPILPSSSNPTNSTPHSAPVAVSIPPAPAQAPVVKVTEGQEPWDDDDERALVSFLSNVTKKTSLDMEDWSRMAREAGRGRSGRSYMMKYHKNRAAYDAKCGRTTPNNHAPSSTVIPPVVSKQTAFVATGHDAPLKRSRPSDFDNPDSPSQRPMRGRPRQSYAEDGNDSSLEGEDEIMEDGDRPSVARIHRPSLMSIPASSASGVPPSPSTVTGVDISSATSSTYPRQSYTPRHSFVTNGHSASPAPGGTTGAAWVTPFSAEDKAEALSFLVNRPQPVDLLDNVRSWVDFAEKHPSHTAAEWLCHYFWHYPTFQSVESNLGHGLM